MSKEDLRSNNKNNNDNNNNGNNKGFHKQQNNTKYSSIKGIRELYINYAGNSNIIKWKEEMIDYVMIECPEVVRIIKEEKKPDVFEKCDELLAKDENDMTKRDEILLREYLSSKRIVDQQLNKLYGIIWNTLSPTSKEKIKQHATYDSIDKSTDTLLLYKLVRSIHEGSSGGVESINQWNRVELFEKISMGKLETPFAYGQRFKDAVEAMKTLKVSSYEEPVLAAKFISSLDNSRFAEFKEFLRNNASINGANNYPSTLADAIAKTMEWYSGRNMKLSGVTRGASGVSFVTAKESKGDKKAEVKKPDADTSQKKTKTKKGERKCYHCGSPDHIRPQCPVLQEEKQGYHAFAEASSSNGVVFTTTCYDGMSPNEREEERCLVFRATCLDGPCPKYNVLLDNGANENLFRDSELLEDVRKLRIPLKFNGVGGVQLAEYAGLFGNYGLVYVSPNSPVNVISWSKTLERAPEVEMNFLKKQNHFEVCFSDVVHTYKLTKKGLYAMDFSNNVYHAACHVTAADGLTQVQLRNVQKVRELMDKIGAPSYGAVKQVVIANGHELGLSLQDVIRCERLHGAGVQEVMGKSTEPNPIRMNLERQLPQPVTQVQFYTDIFFIGPEAFLITVVKPIGLIMTCALGRQKGARSAVNLWENVRDQVSVCRGYRFDVTALHCDGEKGLRVLEKELMDIGIVCNAAVGSHVGMVENAIKHIKQWCRGIISGLKFDLPLDLVKYLVSCVTQRLNLFKSKRGLDGIAPYEAFTGIPINFSKQASVGFGKYCLCTTPNLGARKNDVLTPRAEGCISLGATTVNGAVSFLSIATRKVVTRTKWKEQAEVPKEVHEFMKQWAKECNQGKENQVKEILEEDQGSSVIEDDVDGVEAYSPDPMQQERIISIDPLPPVNDLVLEQVIPPTADAVIEQALEETEEPTQGDVVHDAEDNEADDVHQEIEDDVANGVAEEGTELDQEVPTIVQLPDPEPPPTRSSSRVTTRLDYKELARSGQKVVSFADNYGFNISVKKALKELKDTAVESISKELSQILDKNVFEPMKSEHVSEKERKGIIRSFMFLKKKYSADGSFEKLKSRLVANGAQQDRSLYGDISSPTAAVSSLFMIGAIAAIERRKVWTSDITGAYLNARMPQDSRVLMVLEPEIAKIVIKLRPNYENYLRKDGTIIVRLAGALYGCIESAKLWFERIKYFMLTVGFQQNKIDNCVFNRGHGDSQITVVVYVDDLLITSKSVHAGEEFGKELMNEFGSVKFNSGDIHCYLGMVFNFSIDGELSISMESYVNDLLELCPPKGVSTVPASEALFEVSESKELCRENQDWYHSTVAKILYLAKRTRPDLLQVIAFLTTRVGKATEQDAGKLNKVLGYLNGTRKLGIKFTDNNNTNEVKLNAYVDAAFGVHKDGKSHSGMVITLGSGPVFARSSKQKIVTKSSWEAELVALSDSGSQVIWSRNFLSEQGYKIGKSVIFEDNQGTISSINKGSPSSDRSRHVHVRYFWLKDRIDKGELNVEYISTENMLADLLTKPLQGAKFINLRNRLLNWTS